MSLGRVWEKLRTILGLDERTVALETSAHGTAERLAATESSLADLRLELGRNRERAAQALDAVTAEVRTELGRLSVGVKALEETLASIEAQRRLRESEHRADETRNSALLEEFRERLDSLPQAARSIVELHTGLDRMRTTVEHLATEVRSPERWSELTVGLERVRHAVAHQMEQMDFLKSSLEVDPTLIEEFHEWKGRHPLSPRPLVSVCVPTYNRAQLLFERCLPSILGQSYERLQVIVVGDGCTDDTAERISAICDARVSFINLPRRGDYPAESLRRWMVAGTDAVNKALTRVRGELVTHLDDDDEYLPGRLEKLVSFIRQEACDLVWHPFWYEDQDGRWLLNDAAEFAFSQVTTSSVLYRSWLKKIPWDAGAHRLMEPGDWNRFRRLRYLGSVCLRFPEPLLRHYRERRPTPGAESRPPAS